MGRKQGAAGMIGRQLASTRLMAAATVVLAITLVLVGQGAALDTPAPMAKPAFMYRLSNFDGFLPYSGARIFNDPSSGEILVVVDGGITVFNRTGMEIFRRIFDESYGSVFDAAVDGQGRVHLISYRDRNWSILRLNYRFDIVGEFTLDKLPQEFAEFGPNFLRIRGDRMYLASSSQLWVIQATTEGEFVRGWDLLAALREAGALESYDDVNMGGFTVDEAGNIYFTLPIEAVAFRLSVEGDLRSFGRRGSGTGKFGVISDIAVDPRGNCLIADKLRAVVLIFDKNFQFVNEFGGSGRHIGSLAVPGQILLDTEGRLYVSQLGRRGVSVFQYGGQ